MLARDSLNICQISLNLRSGGFNRYRCDENFSMRMDISTLSKMMKCANVDDTVTIRAQENADTVTFKFQSNNPRTVSTYELRLMNLMNLDQFHIQEPDESCVICLPSLEFSRICHKLLQFGKIITISCRNGGVNFSTRDRVYVSSVNVQVNASALDGVTIAVQEPIALSFKGEFLNHFTKATPLSSQVILRMSPDGPLVVEYTIPDLGDIRYYLAPRNEDGDE